MKQPRAVTFSASPSHNVNFFTAAPLFGTKVAWLAPWELRQGRPEQQTAYLTVLLSPLPSAAKCCLSPLPHVLVPLPEKREEPAAPGSLQLHFGRASLFHGCFSALKTKQRQGETEHISKDAKSANGSHWPHSLEGFIQCWIWSALASSSPILCHAASDSLFTSFPSFFSYGCVFKGMLLAPPACPFFPTYQGQGRDRG